MANSRSLWLQINALLFGYGKISPCVPASRDAGMQPIHNCHSRTRLTTIQLSPNMDIHFRASDIPVQTQGWLATLSHTLSFVTTPTPGRGRVFLYYIALFYHLPDQAHQPHLISPAPGRPTTEGFCIEFSRENLPLGITVNKNSSRFHTTTSLCQHMPSTKGCFPQPRNMSKLRLSSAVPFSYPVFHSLQRERNNDCRPSFF